MQTMTSITDADRLVTLLAEQRDLYRTLQTLSDRQRTLISGDRPELLLNILRERQDVVASLARLNEALGPFRRQWNAAYASLPESRRVEVSSLMNEISSLLRRILQTDQEDGALLAVRKSATGSQIAELTGVRAAGVAYAAPQAPAASSISDVQG